jgi:5'-methylthioadenosine phosphorylase
MRAEIGIIGGTGIYDPTIFKRAKQIRLSTPFGRPSAPITLGAYEGRKVAFLPRHGIGHVISPSQLNSRANIYALKQLGVTRVIGCAAVGSLRERIRPLDLIVPDQLFDRTKLRASTFFEEGIVVHIGFAEPFCPELRKLLIEAARQLGHRVHSRATYVCIEGPQFSTKAESLFHRRMGFDIIGMTALPEAKLAREAELCYALLASVTDWDVWKGEEVSVEMVRSYMKRNEATIRDVLRSAIPSIPRERGCECRNALRDAIITSRESIPRATRERLGLFLDKYLA